MTLAEVVGAGVFVSACVLLMGVTRVIDIFNAWVPLSIVRGIQLAVGLTLAEKVRGHVPSMFLSLTFSVPPMTNIILILISPLQSKTLLEVPSTYVSWRAR